MSHDPEVIILICWFGAQIIIGVQLIIMVLIIIIIIIIIIDVDNIFLLHEQQYIFLWFFEE